MKKYIYIGGAIIAFLIFSLAINILLPVNSWAQNVKEVVIANFPALQQVEVSNFPETQNVNVVNTEPINVSVSNQQTLPSIPDKFNIDLTSPLDNSGNLKVYVSNLPQGNGGTQEPIGYQYIRITCSDSNYNTYGQQGYKILLQEDDSPCVMVMEKPIY